MPAGKHHLNAMLYTTVAALWTAQAVGAGGVVLTDVSGNVGYSFRSILGSSNSDAISNQLRGAVGAQAYLWEPWFANLSAGLRVTQDNTNYGEAGTSSRTIIAGADIDLNVLAQSRTPFSLSYRKSDSRVDTVSLPSPLTALGGYDFSTERLTLRQGYFTELGDRLQLRLDHGTWESSGIEDYHDNSVGVEFNMRRPRHTLSMRTSYQEIGVATIDQNTDIKLANVEHFFHPNRALRFDTMASYYDSDTSTRQPLNSTNQSNANMSYAQLSSFAFWRPADQPLSLSAGLRFFDLTANNAAGNNLDQASVSATAGGFYQFTKNLRFDASVDVTESSAEGVDTSSRERVGALYQSDLRNLLSGFTWNWYTQASVQNQDIGEASLLTGLLTVGHDAQRLWMTNGRGTFRLSFSQSVSVIGQSGDDAVAGSSNVSNERLDHTASLSWDLYGESGSTTAYVTLSDSRGFGDQPNSQQFANFQFMRTQNLTLYSTLSGNLTVQAIQRDFNGQRDSDTVSATGQVTYRHMGLFDIAQLRFNSDLRIARAATDEGIDRAEWENRLDYAIGLVDTSFSWRYISFAGVQNDEAYNIIYFQVTRRF
ncbi:MAG: hypothetical protein LBV36_04345 [Chromatiales bacterium]|jgi:hypothetical protein|nr:hypothetical protein [Chromatiales bacterium]